MKLLSHLLIAAVAMLGLSACSIPRGAAISSEVVSGVGKEDAPFEMQIVSRSFIKQIEHWPGNQSNKSYPWISRQAGPASSLIAAGDTVSIRIWDSGENSLLSTEGQKVTSLEGLKVSPAGTVYIPYVGEVLLTNLTPDGARKELQTKIEGLIPAAQVQLHHQSGRKNTVDLVGGVKNAGSFPLPDRNFSVLSLLSAGGGIDSDLRNPQIRLVRNGTTYGTSIEKLYANPSRDTTLRGGDKVIVDQERRSFIAMGAAKEEDIIYFNQDTVTALGAISLMGGLNDLRADPEGVLIFRNYPDSALRSDGSGPKRDQVVFSIDLTHADGLFSAGQFEIMPGDVVLATESFVTAAGTVAGFFGVMIGLAAIAN